MFVLLLQCLCVHFAWITNQFSLERFIWDNFQWNKVTAHPVWWKEVLLFTVHEIWILRNVNKMKSEAWFMAGRSTLFVGLPRQMFDSCVLFSIYASAKCLSRHHGDYCRAIFVLSVYFCQVVENMLFLSSNTQQKGQTP